MEASKPVERKRLMVEVEAAVNRAYRYQEITKDEYEDILTVVHKICYPEYWKQANQL